MIPAAEKVILDMVSSDFAQALSDGKAIVPDLEKAIADCTGKEFKVEHLLEKIKHIDLRHWGIENPHINLEAASACV